MKINLLRAAAVPFILVIGIIASRIATSGIEHVKGSLFSGIKEIQQKKIQPAVNSAIEKISPTVTTITNETEAALSHHETKWVKGKPLKECMGPGNLIDKDTVICLKDHYEEVPEHEQEAEQISPKTEAARPNSTKAEKEAG